MLKKPSLAEQLPNGLIMANDDYRNRVVVIDPRYDTIVWQYGLTDTAGTARDSLASPTASTSWRPTGRPRPIRRQVDHALAPDGRVVSMWPSGSGRGRD